MRRFRFVHAADLHLDTPFAGVGRTAPAIRDALRDASLDAFDALVELTIARGAVLLLLAGDIYDGAERGLRAQIRFRRGLERLAAARVRVVVAHGNHDPLEGWSAVGGSWPAGVTLLGSAGVQSIAIEQDGERLATVHGVSYARRDVTENLALGFRRSAAPGLHIGLLHCNVGGDPNHAAYSPCTVDDLRRAGMDYWALGHVHQRQIVRSGDPWIVYPGNTQGRSPKPSERGPKGAMVVEIDGDAVQTVEFAAIDCVRFVHVTCDVSSDVDTVPSLVRALAERVDGLQAEHGGRGLVVRATLTGRIGAVGGAADEEGSADTLEPLGEQLRRPGSIVAILQELRHEAADRQPFLWWDAIDDRTRPRLDTDAVRHRSDFAGELLRLCSTLEPDHERLTALLTQGSDVLSRVAGASAGESLDAEAMGELLREARTLALDLLDAEGAS